LPPANTFNAIQAVFFDLDGTLIDSAPDLGAAADKIRTDRGLASLPQALYRPMAGAGARGMLQVALGLSPEHPEFEAAREAFFTNYQNCLTQRTRAFPGVAELLLSLRARQLAWGIVTNKSKRFTEPLVQDMPLLAQAHTVVSGDTTAHAKPHPEPLFEAARRLGVAPEHCVYVGDDERDVQAGLAAGMKTVVATYGYLGQGAPFADWGAHAHIDLPIQLLSLLKPA
jgi:phosphoglycolate phosphatase